MNQFTHILSIRHAYTNLPEHRAELFEKTLESIKNQTCKDFLLIVIDTGIRHCMEFCESFIETPWVMHSRCDNDDLLHPDYIKEVQLRFKPEKMVIDTKGLRVNDRTGEVVDFTFYNDKKTSPFLTVVEPNVNQRGPYSIKHGNFPLEYPVVMINKHLWCQRIHDNNKQMNWKNGYNKVRRPEWVR